MKIIFTGAVCVLLLAIADPIGAAAPADTAAPKSAHPNVAVFASVNDAVITVQEYEAAVAQAIRQKFYHRNPGGEKQAELQREVADNLINRRLLIAESKRRGVGPDAQSVQAQIAAYEERYKGSPQWKTNRSQVLPTLKAELEQRSVLERMEKQVRGALEPTEQQVRTYYDSHHDLFTEPEQVRLSMILLKVDPSAPKLTWDKAREEAQTIIKRLKGGMAFAQLAQLQSADPSAQKGGDMGYVHRGMLPAAAQESVDKLQPGALTDAVTLLEGVAVFRLEDRKTAQLRAFEDVRQRAADLWRREQGDKNWKTFIAALRKSAVIKIDSTRYPALGAAQAAQLEARR
jgi:parvulin-like peptidyl-prolyl isomerase